MRTLAIVVALAVLVAAPIATAHASYYSSEPPRDARLEVAPSKVTLTLSEAVDTSASGIEVRNQDGDRVDQDDLTVDGAARPTFTISLRTDLPAGAYSIKWWAFSSVDQHTTNGVVGFAVGRFEPPGTTQSSTTGTDPFAVVGRTLIYAGFSLALGGLAFSLYLTRTGKGATPSALGVNALVAGSVLLALGFLVLAASTLKLTGLGIADFAASEVGRLLVIRLGMAVAAVPAALALRAYPGRATYAGFIVLLVGLAVLTARFGHNSLHGPAAIALDTVHLVATGTWIGCLALLVVSLRGAKAGTMDAQATRQLGHRFGRVALPAVIAIIATGSITAVWLLGWESVLHPSGLLGSTYGLALAGKVLLVIVMLKVAATNRLVFLADPARESRLGRAWARAARGIVGPAATPLPKHGSAATAPQAFRGFRSFVAAEAVTGVIVLILAAVLTSVSPPAAEAASDGPSLRLSGASGSFDVALHVAPPPIAGEFASLRFYIRDAVSGEPERNNTCGRSDCLHATLTRAGDASNSTQRRPVFAEGTGWWNMTNVLFVEPGSYRLELEIQTAYVYLETVPFEFEVRPA